VPSTSFTHANAIEQVVVRIPQNIPGVVSAILVQNDSAADELGTSGIMVRAISQFGIEPNMWKFMNGDLSGRNRYAIGASAVPSGGVGGTSMQQTSIGVAGCLLIQTYGLSGGDLILQVDSSSATTRTYTPIITASVGARETDTIRQTQVAPGNSAKSIIAPALD
jgi:hypothetical protein